MAMLGVGWCWAALMRRAERMKRLSCKRGSNGAQHTTSYDSHAVMTTAASSSGSVSHRKALHAPNDSQMSGEASACKPDSWCTHGVACHPSLMSACTSHGTSHSSTTKCSGSASEPGASHASHQHLCHLPGVSVVMPVKGCKPHSVHNWGSQVSMHYGRWDLTTRQHTTLHGMSFSQLRAHGRTHAAALVHAQMASWSFCLWWTAQRILPGCHCSS